MNSITATGKFYDRFSYFYPLVDIFLKPQKAILVKEINSFLPGKLLEIGVGNGSHLPAYSGHAITGIDISAGMLKKARSFDSSADLVLMNGEELSFMNESFNYVVISHVLSVTDDPGRLIREAFRVMRPGGKLLILNHFTPVNTLKWLDQVFQPLSRLLHFRSDFRWENIPGIEKFRLEKQQTLGVFSYFKLLIFVKP